MKAPHAIIAIILSFAPCALSVSMSDANTHYACHFLDETGQTKESGYDITLWFDTCVDANFIGNRLGTLNCELEIFATDPNQLIFNCKVNEQLMTLSISKETLTAQANFIEGKEFAMLCTKS